MITKDKILSKTHYGLNIYSFILRRFYENGIVLRISGRECLPANNPYNHDRPTLKIKVVDGMAMHTDFDKSIPDGNVFDFASRYYALNGLDLLYKINEDLNLKFKGPDGIINKTNSPRLESPLFSYFKRPITNTRPSRSISLFEVYHLIRDSAFARHTAQLRLYTDKTVMQKFKAGYFDYVTFSGIFSARNKNALISSSNLMVFDFDNVPDISDLRHILLHDEYFKTELLFTSPSGKGLKWVIPYDPQTSRHEFFFRSVVNYLRKTYKIKADHTGKDIARACFLSHDPNCYINPKYT